MNTSAIVMFIISASLLWGGLIVFLTIAMKKKA
ncbi:MetS family NSS transporter small subunit [Ammoniphilus resinae]|uniref:MetS family NSS transporter small subunit n=1 Tax=Ammoniphilus resinae TaxID=861532 RepID=A0ABS4GV11_9BACL|nr:MetS family NSS transporter small subunit [Ammoniphilus resinae]MBP1933715.1 hypothetical protein [Ammoniphilus resinae]